MACFIIFLYSNVYNFFIVLLFLLKFIKFLHCSCLNSKLVSTSSSHEQRHVSSLCVWEFQVFFSIIYLKIAFDVSILCHLSPTLNTNRIMCKKTNKLVLKWEILSLKSFSLPVSIFNCKYILIYI